MKDKEITLNYFQNLELKKILEGKIKDCKLLKVPKTDKKFIHYKKCLSNVNELLSKQELEGFYNISPN